MLRRQLLQAAALAAGLPLHAASSAQIAPFAWQAPPLSSAARRNWARAASSARWQASERAPGDPHEWLLAMPTSLPTPQVYQPDRLGVALRWIAPDGSVAYSEGFWAVWPGFQGWVARWTPQLPGHWQMEAMLMVDGQPHSRLGAPVHFGVQTVDTLSTIQMDAFRPGYFADRHGEPFFPVGVNLAWATGSVLERYRKWFDDLAQSGGNFARIWMSSWCFGIEWSNTGLANFHARQDHARRLDAVLSMAQARGIRVMLCLLNHGAFSLKADSEWADNPYNGANGGPLLQPQAFFTDEAAIACFQNRLRYVMARWSHSPAIHSWELWNEVTWVPHPAEALLTWLHRTTTALDKFDPYRRLRTCSWADSGPPATWARAGLDFAQQHDYTPNDLATHYQRTAQAWREMPQTLGVVPGELGARSRQPLTAEDIALHTRQFHDGLWAPFMMGYASTALYWWWDHFLEAAQQWHWLRPFRKWVDTLRAHGIDLSQLPPAQRTAQHGAAQTPIDHPAVECWVRTDCQTVVGWARQPGLTAGEGEEITHFSFLLPPGDSATPPGTLWRGEFMPTHTSNTQVVHGAANAQGQVAIQLPAWRGSAVFWLQAQPVADAPCNNDLPVMHFPTQS